MEELNDLSNAFRQKFSNFEEIPTKNVWEKIKKDTSPKIIGTKQIAIVAGSIVVGVALYFAIDKFPQANSPVEPPIVSVDKSQNFTEVLLVDTINQSENASEHYLGLLFEPAEEHIIPFLDYPQQVANNISEEKTTPTLTFEAKPETTLVVQEPVAPMEPLPIQTLNSELIVPVFSQEEQPENPLSKSEANTNTETKSAKEIPSTPTKTESLTKEEVATKYKIFIPSAFSPDGSSSQSFKAVAEDVVSFEMYIFDSKGKQVFVSKDINQGWTGNNASPGGYIYAVKCVNSDGQVFQKRGSVTLIRNY